MDSEEEAVPEDERSDADDEGGSDEDASDATEEADEEEEEEEEEEHLVRRNAQQSQAEKEAEEEFARELAKMMAEGHSTTSSGIVGTGVNSRASQPPRSLFDQGLPFIRRNANGNELTPSSSSSNGPALVEGQMRFDLLTKRGNKVKTSALHLPNDSAIAVTTREKQMKELQERKLLKEYVLGYEGREESEERMALEQSLGRRGFKVKQGQGQGQGQGQQR